MENESYIKNSPQFQQRLSDALLEEACRQWCDFIDDAPERLDGKGFADFHREIVGQKYDEYAESIFEYMRDGQYEPEIGPADTPQRDEQGIHMDMS